MKGFCSETVRAYGLHVVDLVASYCETIFCQYTGTVDLYTHGSIVKIYVNMVVVYMYI